MYGAVTLYLLLILQLSAALEPGCTVCTSAMLLWQRVSCHVLHPIEAMPAAVGVADS